MAAKDDGECEPRRRPKDHGLRSGGRLQRNWAKESGALARVRTGMRRVAKAGNDGGTNSWQKGSGKKGDKAQEKGGQRDTRTCWDVRQDRTHCSLVSKRRQTTICTPLMKMTAENVKEATDNEENLHAWCLLEESENEQWQDGTSRRSKHRAKKVNRASLLSVESSHSLSPKKNCGGESQVGEGQRHHGLWSCGSR